LAKGASANLTIFLALSEPAKIGGISLCRASPFFNGLIPVDRLASRVLAMTKTELMQSNSP